MTRLRFLTAGLVAVLGAGQAGAINIVLDYTYDTQGFFANAVAKATLEKAAADLSTILTDTFSSISTPAPFQSQQFNGVATWSWSLNFNNPGVNGGPTVTLNNQTIPADTYLIYAGGRSLSGSTLGVGGPGGFNWSSNPTGGFTSAEINQLNAITNTFSAQVTRREEPAGEFARWGGSITFDTDAGTNWHYDWQTLPTSGKSDLYSVALHELMHAVGFGTSNEWSTIAVGGFDGAASVAEFGGSVAVNGGHWQYGTMSTVLRDGDAQETAMDPDVTTGTRKLLTDLDIAALDDIGWDVNLGFSYGGDPADLDADGDVDDADFGIAFAAFTGPNNGPSNNPAADLDNDGDVDDADFGIAFAAFTGPGGAGAVPEPASLALLAISGVIVTRRRRS